MNKELVDYFIEETGKKFDRVEKSLSRMDERLMKIEARPDKVNCSTRLEDIEEVQKKLIRFKWKIGAFFAGLLLAMQSFIPIDSDRFEEIGNRIKKIESILNKVK
jgi:ppGpp synthetase/RelA/SpoT-type nucleotidyltranferase